MMSFREFFEQQTGMTYPGEPGERIEVVQERVFRVFADFADEIAANAQGTGLRNVEERGNVPLS